MQEKRKDPTYKSKEREGNMQSKQEKRKDPTYKSKEREGNMQSMQEKRKDPTYKSKERAQNMQNMQERRQDLDYLERENTRRRSNRHIERQNDVLRYRHNFYNKINSEKNSADSQCAKNKLKFIESRNETPEFICCCCENLFFKHSVTLLNLEAIREKLGICEEEFLEFRAKIYNVQSEYLCNTCKNYIMKQGKVPKLATSNGLKFVEIPECIKTLSPLESRLCSPFLPFMCIKPMKAFSLNGQLGLRGSVVNISIDVNEMLTVLPRSFDEMSTIQVQLKRHFQHKSYYMFETIRPAAVCDALRYLRNTPLYIKHDIKIDDKYLEVYSGTQAEIDFVVENMDLEIGEPRINIEPTEEEMESDEDTGEEVMLLDRNTVAQGQENIHIIAPGQGKNPVAPQFIENFDELCFPKIFCGHGFNIPRNITYNDRAKSECRRVDRRSCNPERLLFMAKQKIERQITSSINVCLRKTKKGSGSMKASDLLNQDFVNGLITFDSGYSFTKQIRNSPAYLEIKKKELLATIRTLGKPTFFLTLSAAETRWPELLACLARMNSGEKISITEALEMSNFDRTTLIRNDPVTCARYFDHKISNFMKLIRTSNSIFKTYIVEETYERTEFQVRGSPHLHCFLWLRDAPKFDIDELDSLEKVVEFIDEFITCQFDDSNPYVDLQKHKHTHTCYKTDIQKKQRHCRFNIPIACMPETRILLPLPEEEKTEKMKENFKKIEGLMKHYYIKMEDRSFEYVLEKLEMNEDDYILAIRSSLKQVRVFLKRGTQEVGINGYNKDILCLFEANMDIQFVLEEYGLASYIVNYISKCEAGLSKLLRNASKDIESGNVTLKEKFRKIGNVFLNGSLMSAQEAVYYLLCMPVSKNSRRVILINTGPQAERVGMLKSKSKLSTLPGDSNDVFEQNIIEKYCKRKKALENICLAEYAACYHRVNKDIDDRNDDEETDAEELRLRGKHAILRFRRYKLAKDPDNYYRERLLLCLPFRNELTEIEGLENYEEVYQAKFEIVSRNEDKFGLKSVIDERIENAIVEVGNEEQEEQDGVGEYEIDPMYQVDVFDQGGIGRGSKENTKTRYTIPKRVSPQALQEMLSKLNTRQGKFVNYILDRFQTNELPVRIFLSGSAGVGKSTVINAIYQSVTNYFDELPGGNNDKIVVLLTAYSGKASYLIGGVTLHTALALPVSQFGGRMPELSADIANTIRENLSHTKLLIIDEISFIGSTFFSRIDCRLRQIFGKNESFGGLSVLVVGDLFQLPPLFDRPIFQFSMNEFGNLVDRNPLWDEFSFYELTEVMRQREDLEFVRVLNNIAIGQVDDNDINTINTRAVSPSDIPRGAIRLYNRNIDVTNFNNLSLTQHEGPEYKSIAKDSIVGTTTENRRIRILNSIKNKNLNEVNGLPDEIRLKIGIKYMLTSNVNVGDGLCNGATGVLMHIVFKPGTNEPLKMCLKFDRPEVGSKKREEQKNYMIREGISSEYTPIDRVKCVLNMSYKQECQVVREQFPAVCAEAITIHKSQGQTYDQVAIDFNTCKGLTRPMLYVALSRVTKLSGLFIIGKFLGVKAPKENDPVILEMERLRKEKQLDL
uniref:ATP-dependent DNA helicase n=1 Tax=Cacopsylla melanoneura TaxID=428564 RepID=A0A8D8UR91_9HEMI